MKFVPYSQQSIDQNDIRSISEMMLSDFLTTGPIVDQFEREFSNYCGCEYAVAVSSGTAALHSALFAANIGPGDEVIVSPMTFSSTVNIIVFCGASPVFCDVHEDTLLIDCFQAEKHITSKTKAIIAIDYAGHPCDYDCLNSLSKQYGLVLISDACHSLGAKYKNKQVGSLADITAFSFHPAKSITTGEGGMISTNNPVYFERAKLFRNHGIDTDYKQRLTNKSWEYDICELGYNYRLTDIQCSLGISQLRKLDQFIVKRQTISSEYDKILSGLKVFTPLSKENCDLHANHLYVVKSTVRDAAFYMFRQNNIGVNVHYCPVHLFSFYRKNFGTQDGMCPIAEQAYQQILSLPIFPDMTENDMSRVVEILMMYN